MQAGVYQTWASRRHVDAQRPCGRPVRSPMVIRPGGARCRRRFGRSRADRPYPHHRGAVDAARGTCPAWGARFSAASAFRWVARPGTALQGRSGSPVSVAAGPVAPRPLAAPDSIGTAPGASVTDAASPATMRASRLARGHEPGAPSRATAARRTGRAGFPWPSRRKRTRRRRMPAASAAQSSSPGPRHPDPPRRAPCAPPGTEPPLR